MKNFWKFLSFILFGWIVGMFFKEKTDKPDQVINQNIKQKGKGNILRIFKRDPEKKKQKNDNKNKKKLFRKTN